MIVFFGQHEIIDQWREVIGDDKRFCFCKNYQELSAFEPKTTVVVYVRIPNVASLRIAIKLKLKGYKVAKFWAGTDSRYYNDAKGIESFISTVIIKCCIDINLSPAPWLASVLEGKGLKTNYWQSCSPIFLQEELLSITELPISECKKIQRVLVYSNPDRHWIYNTDLMLSIAKSMPNISFTIVGDHTLEVSEYDNVESLGRINQQELFTLYKECDVLLRITSHDGYSRMAVEGMYFGMHVITNWPVPHAMVCHTETEIKEVLLKELKFNRAGYDFIRKEFNVTHWKNTLIDVIHQSK